MKKSHGKFTNTKCKCVSFLVSIFLVVAFLTGCSNYSEKSYVSSTADVIKNGSRGNKSVNVIKKFGNENDLLKNKKLNKDTGSSDNSTQIVDINNIPAFSGNPFIAINNNVPYFVANDLVLGTKSFEFYSEFDELGRCGIAYASVSTDTMPTEDRGDIGQIKPTGWHTVKYDIVDGKYLYNRCHLIGYQLSAENVNEKNLMTGTRYMNVQGMLPFENMVADYIKETGNHVLYRITPVFDGSNLLASGILIEAESVEDQGEDILFCVYVYNVQPGIIIDYATGESCIDTTITQSVEQPIQTQGVTDYILNTNTRKFHYPACSSVAEMAEKNKQTYTGSRDEIIAMGYEPCKRCKP